MEEKKLTGNELNTSLNSEDFRQYFRKNILPRLEPIEESRAKAKVKIKIALMAIGILVVVLIPFALIFLSTFSISSGSKGTPELGALAMPLVLFAGNLLFWCIIIALFAFVIIMLAKTTKAKNELKELVRKKIKPILFSYLGNFKRCDTPAYNASGAFNLLKDLKVYEKYNDIVINDCIEGEYSNLKLKVVELNVGYITGAGKSKQRVQIFDGLMFEVDMNKKFNSHTVVKTDRDSVLSGKEFQHVSFENPEFEREFGVYSTDRAESEYLLTPPFMQRLLEMKQIENRCIEVVFCNQKAFLFISCNSDMFELPRDKSATDTEYYQNIILDLTKMLRVVDALSIR